MVEESEFEGRPAYKCGQCGFKYVDEKTAKRCEDFCKKHNSCSMKITKNALR